MNQFNLSNNIIMNKLINFLSPTDILYQDYKFLEKWEREYMEKTEFAKYPKYVDRYQNIIPYKFNILSDPLINASMIEIMNTKIIAAQAPLPKSFFNFFYNIYKYKVRLILNLTPLEQSGIVKANKYWPDLHTIESYKIEDVCITVANINEINCGPNLLIRVLRIQVLEEQFIIKQIHYTGWPDHGVPNKDEMVQFFRMLYLFSDLRGEIPLIHCSAGIGRTGTFIAIWNLITTKPSNEIEQFIKLTVLSLRQQRCNMVQSFEQYRFIYTTLKFKEQNRSGCQLAQHDKLKLGIIDF